MSVSGGWSAGSSGVAVRVFGLAAGRADESHAPTSGLERGQRPSSAESIRQTSTQRANAGPYTGVKNVIQRDAQEIDGGNSAFESPQHGTKNSMAHSLKKQALLWNDKSEDESLITEE